MAGTAPRLGRLNAWVEGWGDHQMRDISGDLQDRANLLERQIAGAQGQFDKLIEQLTIQEFKADQYRDEYVERVNS